MLEPLPRASWAPAALLALMSGAALNGFTVTVMGLSVYPENLALGLVAIVVAVAAWRGRLSWHWPAGSIPLAGWLAVTLLASLIHAPDMVHSVILWHKLLFAVATFMLAANLSTGRTVAAAGLQCAVAVVVAAWGLLAVALWWAARWNLGMQRAPGGGMVPTGPLLEANLLGSYTLAAMLLGLAMLTSRGERPRWQRAAAWTAALLGPPLLLLSVTRTAWVAAVAALGAAGAVAAWRSGRRALRWGLAAAGAAMLAVAAVEVPVMLTWSWAPMKPTPMSASVSSKVSSFADLRRDTDLWVRFEVCRDALRTAGEHPWIGWGAGAFGDLYLYPDQNTPAWIPNFFVHHLFDGGLIGLALLVAAIARIAWRGIQAWRCSADPLCSALAGLLLALIGLGVAFQTTEASWLAYPWILLGLLEGGSREAAAGSRC